MFIKRDLKFVQCPCILSRSWKWPGKYRNRRQSTTPGFFLW